MSRTLAWLALGLLLSGCTVLRMQGNLPNPPREEALPYYSYVNHLLAGGNTDAVDFHEMRLAYTHARDYQYVDTLPGLRTAEVRAAIKESDHKKCLRLAEDYIVHNYTSLLAHNWLRVCHRGLGHIEQANYHTEIIRGLLYSIFASGDGGRAETPIEVISTEELMGFFHLMAWAVSEIEMVDPQRQLFRVSYRDYGLNDPTLQTLWVMPPAPLLERISVVPALEDAPSTPSSSP